MSGKTAVVSGGFDPLHPGHLNLFRLAKMVPCVETLTVIVGSDEWVRSKHGRIVLPQSDRTQLVSQLREVDTVHASMSPDGDESDCIRILRPDYFVVGPDHNDPIKLQEYAACQQIGAKIVIAHELTKDHSSSELIKPRWTNPPVTVSLVFREPSGTVLVCERLDGKLDVPGGFLEPGESLEACCVREVMEETGVCVARRQLQYLASMQDKYPDGRDIVSVYFLLRCGSAVRDYLRVGPEHRSHRWVRYLKDVSGPGFFSLSDHRAVLAALEGSP